MILRHFLILSLLSLSACFSVPINAPTGQDVQILPAGTPVEVTERYQKWYALWGIFPLTPSDKVAAIIEREKLVEVRVYTEDSIEDAISGFFYVLLFPAGIIVPQTIVVEGNRSKSKALQQSVFR
jgi:hypothetical protein